MRTAGLICLVILSASAQEIRDSLQRNDPTRVAGAAAANSFIVTFKPGTPKIARAQAAQAVNAVVRHNYDIIDAIAITVPNANAANALRSNQNVVSVRKDYYVYTIAKPGTPGGGNGGGNGGNVITGGTRQLVTAEVQRVGTHTATSNGAGVGVAILDTGLDMAHADLSAGIAAQSYNAFTGSTTGTACQDDVGHGTHIAGMIGARDNNIDILGVAPNSTLYCVKVLGTDPLLNQESVVIAGLNWLFLNRASFTVPLRVINMSLGRAFDPVNDTHDAGPFFDAINQFYNAGIVVIVSAGNDYSAVVSNMVPAEFSNVIAVASTVATTGIQICTGYPLAGAPRVYADTAAEYTTDGAGIAVSAPGDERHDSINSSNGYTCLILLYGTVSTTLGGGASRKLGPNGTQEARGTSFSAALVSGAAARVIQKGLVTGTGSGFVEGVRTWLKDNTDRKGQVPFKHPWFVVTDDFIYEGIAQAPK